MTQHIDAIYEHGLLRPMEPLALPEQARVRLTVNSADPATPAESFFDAASRLGLIGSLEGGPPDLSTSPRHMEGFGGG
jgi:predicted DNA-binding antitoxin AbrB/MazE fold protein